MAKAPKNKGETTITRIKSTDSAAAVTKSTAAKPVSIDQVRAKRPADSSPKTKKDSKNPFKAIGAYFKGAWYELRQVRWPDRRSTWGMTGALLAFTAFFVVVILLLDFGFEQLFNLLTGK